jgi:hypothetical protein
LSSFTIVSVGPNMETAVSRMLDRLDLDHEWFRIRRRVVYRGRLILRIMPLFPGYMFLQACESCWVAVEAIIGVRGFVRFGGTIETVPARALGPLRSRVGADGILNEDALPFQPGDRVALKLGGQETTGIFKDYIGPARVLVEVPMLGRTCSVTARLGDLQTCSD